MTSRVAGWFQGYRSALAHRDLRLLLGGQLVSTTGTWAYNVALLAYVFERTHSLGWVAGASLVRYIPVLLFSAYGGVLAERVERVRLLAIAGVLCGAFQVALTVIAAANAPIVIALAFSALTASVSVVFDPAVAATIPSVVDEDSLVAANALGGTIDNLVVIAGPAIGAVLLLLGSAAAVFGVNAVSFFLFAAIIVRMHTRTTAVDVTEAGAAGPLQQVAVGARTIIRLPAARVLVAFSALVSFVYGTDTVLFMGVSEHRLGTGTQGFGYLLAGLGVGGILAAGVVDRLAGSRRLATIIIAGTLGYCLPTALLTVIHSPVLAFFVQAFRGGSTLVVDVLAVTALQRAVPSDQLARVFGVFFAFILAAIALGTLVTPPVVSALGLNGALLVMALGPSLIALGGYPALAAIDRQTAALADRLAPRVAVLERLEIFATASRPVLERLVAEAEELQFAPGAVVIREGTPADALYVLLDGEVRVTASGEGGGPEHQLRTMTAPTYFGEIGVLERIPRTATVTAVSECRCDRIDGDALLSALSQTPPSTSLMEVARTRLAVTHPSRQISSPELRGDLLRRD